ncbi:hypothetical protein [Paenibacillus alkalitolerans]|uniref:hypothetical protein n=1 Tax=Paenibacillus alkalitolerans TaxID=2799335 RepID=UPI0018F5FABA|nr:hypothetical protein [Paenibacillus alkalitolerans]
MTTFATRQIIRETLLEELQVTPELLRKAERRYYEALARIAELKERLTALECELYSSGTVSGKNEAVRLAELWPHTGPLHSAVREAESESDRLKSEVFYLRRKLDNLQLMTKLLVEEAYT